MLVTGEYLFNLVNLKFFVFVAYIVLSIYLKNKIKEIYIFFKSNFLSKLNIYFNYRNVLLIK